MKQMKFVIVFALLFAGMSFGREMNINMNIVVDGMEEEAEAQIEVKKAPKKKAVKESSSSLKTIKAVMGEEGIELSDGRLIPVTYAKAMFPYPQIEVLEPVGAKVTIIYGKDYDFNSEIPFIWKDAGIDEYVKMTVTEDDVTWSIKFQAKKGKEITIGSRGAEPKSKRGHHGGSLKSKHFSIDSKVRRAGESFVVKFFNFPASGGQDWMNIVPVGAAEDEWGTWQYANGVSGEFTISGLEPGNYELRAFYNYPNGGYVIRDRMSVTVK